MNNKTLKIILVLVGFFAFTHQAYSKMHMLRGLTAGVFYNHGVNSGPGVMLSKNVGKKISVVATAGYAVPVETTSYDFHSKVVTPAKTYPTLYSGFLASSNAIGAEDNKLLINSHTMSLGVAYTFKYMRLSGYYLKPQAGLGVYRYGSTVSDFTDGVSIYTEADYLLMGWAGVSTKVMKNVRLSLTANVLKLTARRVEVSVLNVSSDPNSGSKEYRASISVGLQTRL